MSLINLASGSSIRKLLGLASQSVPVVTSEGKNGGAATLTNGVYKYKNNRIIVVRISTVLNKEVPATKGKAYVNNTGTNISVFLKPVKKGLPEKPFTLPANSLLFVDSVKYKTVCFLPV